MRCDGVPVTWPQPTHGDPKTPAVQGGKLAPWRTAAECIDWSIPAQSIFDRKKPLAENTLKRIARGIQRFVIDSASPFIVKCNHTTTKGKYDCFRGQGLAEPLQTITKTHGYAIAVPHLTKFRTGATGQPVTEPVPTVTAGTSARPGGNGHALGVVEAALTPFIARIGQTGFGGDRMAYDAKSPLTTVTSKNEHLLVAPVIARQFGASIGHRADEPSATITAGGGGKSQLVSTTLIQMGYGERPGQEPRVPGLHKPLGTVVAGGGKFGLVAANLVKHFGGNYQGAGVGLDEPAHTVTTTDHHGLVTSHLVMLRGTCRDGRVVDAPAPGLTAGGLHVGNVETRLATDDYDEQRAAQALAFLREYCGADSDGLVKVDGVVYRIVDIPGSQTLSCLITDMKYDSNKITMTLSEAPDWSFENPRVIVRHQDGRASAMVVPTRVDDFTISVPYSAALEPQLWAMNDAYIEPPRLLFCSSVRVPYGALVGEISPGNDGISQVTAIQYHPGKYAYDDATYPGDAA